VCLAREDNDIFEVNIVYSITEVYMLGGYTRRPIAR